MSAMQHRSDDYRRDGATAAGSRVRLLMITLGARPVTITCRQRRTGASFVLLHLANSRRIETAASSRHVRPSITAKPFNTTATTHRRDLSVTTPPEQWYRLNAQVSS